MVLEANGKYMQLSEESTKNVLDNLPPVTRYELEIKGNVSMVDGFNIVTIYYLI